MSGKHTAGPWLGTIEFKPPSSMDEKRNIAILCAGGSPRADEARANFDLAFAAPELLEALKSAVITMDAAAKATGSIALTYEVGSARAAISKAEGRTSISEDAQ